MNNIIWYRIETPKACGAVVIDENTGVCIDGAPYFKKFLLGKDIDYIKEYLQRMGYKIERLGP